MMNKQILAQIRTYKAELYLLSFGHFLFSLVFKKAAK